MDTETNGSPEKQKRDGHTREHYEKQEDTKGAHPPIVSPSPLQKEKRDGHTREHYEKQKGQQYSYFRIRTEDLPKMRAFQFSIYDFITNSFAFSQTKKQLAVSVLEELKSGPLSFIELQKKLGAKKSTLYLLILALQRSGLVSKAAKNEKLKLDSEFSEALRQYAEWWGKWAVKIVSL